MRARAELMLAPLLSPCSQDATTGQSSPEIQQELHCWLSARLQLSGGGLRHQDDCGLNGRTQACPPVTKFPFLPHHCTAVFKNLVIFCLNYFEIFCFARSRILNPGDITPKRAKAGIQVKNLYSFRV